MSLEPMSINKKYVIAVIRLPIEILENGTTRTLEKRSTVEFEKCNELPPEKDDNSNQIISKLSEFIDNNEDFFINNNSAKTSVFLRHTPTLVDYPTTATTATPPPDNATELSNQEPVQELTGNIDSDANNEILQTEATNDTTTNHENSMYVLPPAPSTENSAELYLDDKPIENTNDTASNCATTEDTPQETDEFISKIINKSFNNAITMKLKKRSYKNKTVSTSTVVNKLKIMDLDEDDDDEDDDEDDDDATQN